MDQVAAKDHDDAGVLAVPWVDHVGHGVEHYGVEVVVVGTGARSDDDFAGGFAVLQHTLRGIVAVLLQPADVDVLEQRVGGTVGGGGGAGTVEADHDAVECLALEDGVAQAGLEVRHVRPGVEQGVADGSIEVGLLARIPFVVQGGDVTRGTNTGAAGVGAAGNGAADAYANFVADQLIDGNHADAAQELTGLLHAGFQLLLDRRVDGESLGGVGHAAELGDLGGVGFKKLASIVAHGVLR